MKNLSLAQSYVSSQKEGGSGVFWAGFARPKHPTPRFIEKIQSYLVKAEKRLKILDVLLNEDSFSDVVREAQEIVELALKGMLRQAGIEPPKWDDVGPLILQYQDRFPASIAGQAEKLAQISAWLRKEREFSFYGDIDFIPTEQYNKQDALKAIEDAHFVVSMAKQTIQAI